MKKTNSVVLLIVALLLIIVGGGIYFAQKSGRINLFAAFAGWSDVTISDPAYTEIMAVGENGWVAGFSDGTYRPDDAAERAQIVVAEVNALGLPLQDASQECNDANPLSYPFLDVPCNHWAVNYIYTAKKAGIIDRLLDDANFNPDQAATRAGLVAFIVDATTQNVPDYTCSGPADYPFPDVPCGFWDYNRIRYAKENNLIFADPSGNFNPDDTATRRDLAVILYRAFISTATEVTISGQVTSTATGSPIASATVYVATDTAQGSKLNTSSDSTGAYSLRFVSEPTTYAITAQATGYQSKTISVSASQNAGLDIQLSPVSQASEGTITGYVRNADTKVAIAGATVTVLGYESGSQLSDKTDSRGYYSLKVGSTTGTFSIKASASGYRSKTSSATLSGGAAYLSFALSKVEETSSGETPGTGTGTNGSVNAATTGAVLPIALVLVGTILALFSLIYLLKTNKKHA